MEINSNKEEQIKYKNSITNCPKLPEDIKLNDMFGLMNKYKIYKEFEERRPKYEHTFWISET